MGNISGKAKIDLYYNYLINYTRLYSRLFANLVTITNGSGESQTSTTYNATELELNGLANKIINIIGGNLLNTSIPGEESESTEPSYTDGIIIPNILEAFTIWFKDFNYDNAMLLSSDSWINDNEIKESSLYKVKSISLLNSCNFINSITSDIIEYTNNQFDNLNDVKNLLNNHYNILNNSKSLIISVINAINALRTFYNTDIMNVNSNSMYASNADYMSHQYYIDSSALEAINSWSPITGIAINSAESVVPNIIYNNNHSIDNIINQINEISNKLNSNNAISMLNSLKFDINNQYLSNYLDNYGHRIALIISELMTAIPEDSDYTLTDKLSNIEQELESTVLDSLSRYTVYNKFGSRFLSNSNIMSNHTNLLHSLKSAVSNLDAISN